MEVMWDIEILMMIPFTSLIEYPSETEDIYIENHLFYNIRQYLDIEINVYAIMDVIGYNLGRRENGAISVYYSKETFDKYILIDTYLGATDQLELVYVGFRCPRNMADGLRKLVRQFNDSSQYSVYYCEGTNPVGYKYKNNFELFEYLSNDNRFKTIPDKKYIFYRDDEVIYQID